MKALALLLSLFLSSVAHADARDPVTLVMGQGHGTPVLDSDGDLTVVLRSKSTTDVGLQTSDGRGLAWSSPRLLTPPGSAAEVSWRLLGVRGDRAYAVFADDRHDQGLLAGFTATTPFLRIYDHQAGSLGPEVPIPTGILPQHHGATSMDLVVDVVGGAHHLHLAMVQHELDPVWGGTIQRVAVYTSHDGGATWLAPRWIEPHGSGHFGEVRVLVDGGQVSVLYERTDFTPGPPHALHHVRSVDAGLTYTPSGSANQVPGAADIDGFDADLEGTILAVAYDEQFTPHAYVRTSIDGGQTWNPPALFHDSQGGADAFGHPSVAVLGDGQVCAGATAFYFLDTTVVTLHSPDGGQTWPHAQQVGTGGKHPRVLAAGPGRDRAVAIWQASGWGAGIGGIYGATSITGGASFAPATLLLTGTTLGPTTSATWNDLYQNVIVGYGDSTVQKVGGMRPQEVVLSGFTAGSAGVQVDVHGFDGGAELAWLLLSTNTTGWPLPLGDGRELGLGLTTLLTDSLSLALLGTFAASVAPTGSGQTPLVPVPPPGIPPGLTMHAVGLSWDVDTASFVDISDVVRIDT